MSSVQLDQSSMLGFKILQAAQPEAKPASGPGGPQLGSKVGVKPDTVKLGSKVGSKVGGKPVSSKLGSKIGGKPVI